MANEMQRGNLTGTATMRMPISGTVSIGGKQMKELRFMPYSEFPETGREETLYIDTVGNAMYYWNGTEYIELSGGGSGGTSNYNELSNKPQISGNVLTGNKTASNLGLQETISDIDTIRSGAESGSTAVQPATLANALATKQDTISDLASIRSGASKGDTAVQPSDMESALSEKQDTISDLQMIRSGAALGATAVQPSDLETALADKQDVISDLDAIRSGATAGNTALQPEDVDTLPTDGSSNPVSSGGTYNFVNSSIATNTAYFIGTFASVEELEAYTGTVTNNDYAFVTSTDSAGNTLYNRYKYNLATQEWSFEYAVNNTAFTAAQWAAIQSGLTSSDKTKLDGIEQGANKTVIDATPTSGSSNAVSSGGVHTALSGKQDTIADLSDIRSGASAGATAVQPAALSDYQTKLSGTNKLDPSFIEYDASHRAVSGTEKTTWNGKQDAISDLSTIRSGAAAGATALQQSDVSSTYSATGTAPVNGTAVNAAIETLDVGSVGGSGKYISAISEENGKIAATPTTFDTALSRSSTNSNAPTSKAVYDDQQRQEAEIAVIANAGAKNLLDYTFSINGNTNNRITNGVTFTINADRSISTSGTASAIITSAWIQMNYVVPSDPVILSGCPAGGANNTYRIDILDGSSTSSVVAADYGNGVLIKSSMFTNGIGLIRIRIANGQNVDGLVFKPMIRPASITDPTFQPYALPNPTLTPAVIKAVDEGAKSIFPIGVQSKDYSSTLSMTVDNEGVITVNGTRNNSSGGILYQDLVTNKTRYQDTRYTLPVGTYVCKGGGTESIRLQVYCHDGTDSIQLFNSSEDGTFTYSQTQKQSKPYITFRLAIQPGNVSLNNHKVYPMICTAADWAVSQKFVPYCPTNRELYGGELQYEVSDVVDNLNATFVDKTNSKFKIYKYGRFCFADVSLKLNTNNLTGNDTITSTALPEKVRPEFDFYGVAVARDNGTWALANMLSVPFKVGATNGLVLLRAGTGHSSALYVTATALWYASNT